MKKKLTLSLSVLLAMGLLVGCNAPSNDDDDDVPPPPGGGTVTYSLEEALEKDYSNCLVATGSAFREDPDDLDISEFSQSIMYYKGYAISYNPELVEFGDDYMYTYYHDYTVNGETKNLMWMNGSASEGETSMWLEKNDSGFSYALGNTAFHLPEFLTGLDLDKVVYAGSGIYQITNAAEVSRLNHTVFRGVWENDIKAISITLDTDGFLRKIYGFEDLNNDKEYFVASIEKIGQVLFDDSKLPEAPNANNVGEFWQYKGWAGPTEYVYPDQITLGLYESTNTSITLEIEGEARLDYAVHFPTMSGDKHYVEKKTLSYVSSNPAVAVIDSAQHDEFIYKTIKGKVYQEYKAEKVVEGETQTVWAYRNDEGYIAYSSVSNDYAAFDVAGWTLTARTEKVWHKTVKAIGAGSCEIYIIGESAQDTQELNVTPKHGVQSNRISVTVSNLTPQDKEGMVYNFAINSVDDEGVINATNLANNDAPYTITSHGLYMGSGANSYSGAFDDPATNYAVLKVGDQQLGYNAYIDFDFGDQQVSSMNFYYGFFYKYTGTYKLTEATIKTSNDGETWATNDIKDTINNNISLNNAKYLNVNFAPASKVRLEVKLNFSTGANYSMVVDSLVFNANSNCHMHELPKDPTYVTSVTVSGNNEMNVGETQTMTATVAPADADSKIVTWASSNTEVATIDSETGAVTALLAGSTTITATSSYAGPEGATVSSAAFTITVKNLSIDAKYAGTYQLHDEEVYLTIDTTAKTLHYIKYDLMTYAVTYETTMDLVGASEGVYNFRKENDKMRISFTTGGSLMVSTSGASVINGESLGGSKWGNFNKVNKITSISASLTGNGVSFANGAYTIAKGTVGKIAVTVTPTGATYGAEYSYSLGESEIEIASIDRYNANFTAKNAGTTTVTVTSKYFANVTSTITVNVVEVSKIQSITLTSNAVDNTAEINTNVTITAAFGGTNINSYSLAWTYSKSGAKVSETTSINNATAVVKLTYEGTVTVTLTDSVNHKQDSLTITFVKPAPVQLGVPANYVGTYTTSDVMEGYAATIEVNADGTGSLTIEGETYSGTVTEISDEYISLTVEVGGYEYEIMIYDTDGSYGIYGEVDCYIFYDNAAVKA